MRITAGLGRILFLSVLGLVVGGCSEDEGVTCSEGQRTCGGVCADTSRDPLHCGACGLACGPGQACSAGACVTSCPVPLTDCNGSCVDLASDRNNCGGCGLPCGNGMVCSANACASSCAAPLTDCSGSCVNTETDRENCGGCGDPCADGEICTGGQCELSCQDGLTDCSGTCVDLSTDREHCGGCGDPCLPGEVCSNAQCALSCQDGLTDCDGTCVDLTRDDLHCGDCATTCSVPFYCEASGCVDPHIMPVELQFLALSDWHGQLDSYGVGFPTYQVGGASALSTYFANERALNPNTLTLSSGDSFGASLPLSGFFSEEPTIYAMNLMGFDESAFGNHAFDNGITALQSLIDLATVGFVSSNLGQLSAELNNVDAPYRIVTVDGVNIAIIGIETPETPNLVMPGNMNTLTVEDPVTSAIAARDAAAAAGATVFVAVAHVGATAYDANNSTYSGPLIDLATGLSGFQLVIGGHTHMEVNTTVGDTIVVQGGSKGGKYVRVRMMVMPYNGAVVQSESALVEAVTANVTTDQAVEDMLAPYRVTLAAQMDGVIGIANDVFVRGSNIERLQEVALGDLAAEAMRDRYQTDLALTNGGGLRAPLPSSYLPQDTTLRRTTPGYAAGPPYDLVIGDVYAVLPFGNVVVTRTVTGTQVWAMLENGVNALPAANGKFAQIAGMRFTYDENQPAGSRVLTVTLEDGVTPIPNDDQTVYTFATNDYVNSGGDGYTMLADGEGEPRDVMADVLLDYIVANTPITPTTDGRITDATP